jgi:D-alanyl-D-alanine carboxypeptidase (penicillin-binding protein 5/6)
MCGDSPEVSHNPNSHGGPTGQEQHERDTVMRVTKRAVSIAGLFGLLACLFFLSGSAHGMQEVPLEITSPSALLMDGVTGRVTFEKSPQKRLSPAGLAKVMTLYLAFDALKGGLVKPDQKVFVSEKAWKTGGSQMFLKVGDEVPFVELLKAVAAISANDGSVAIAEFLEGSEQAFVRKMNEKAKALGLENTHFANSHGLFSEGQYTTAYDAAVLGFHYVRDHPDALALHSIPEYKYGDIKQKNWNKLLEMDERVDGLKTGYVSEAGYHILASAKEGGQRFIAVVMGAESSRRRDQDALKLLDYGFKNFTTKAVVREGETVGKISVQGGKVPELDLVAEETVIVTVGKEKAEEIPMEREIPESVSAPITRGQVLAKLIIKDKGVPPRAVNLVAPVDVPAKSYTRFYQLGLLVVIGLLALAIWRIRNLKRRR